MYHNLYIGHPVRRCNRKKMYILFVLVLFKLKVLYFNYFDSIAYFCKIEIKEIIILVYKKHLVIYEYNYLY